MMISG